MRKKLIRCSTCNRVIADYDGHELARVRGLAGVEWSDSDLRGAKEFLRAHSGHPLEELAIEEETWVSEKPWWDPSGVSYFLAGNVRGKFWVQRKKPALDQSAVYEIIPGRLRIDNVSLKIQEADLRRQIAADKEVSPLLQERMERFIQLFQDEVAEISPEQFEEEAGGMEEGESSLSAYGGLSNSRWARILNRCRLYFDESELQVIHRFTEENRHPPDVLSVQVDRQISYVSQTGAVSSLALLEGKEFFEARESRPVAASPKG